MQLDTIQAFVAVARAGSFAEAGRRLRVPRSTLSRQIQRLERSLGVPLMARTTRAVSIQPASPMMRMPLFAGTSMTLFLAPYSKTPGDQAGRFQAINGSLFGRRCHRLAL